MRKKIIYIYDCRDIGWIRPIIDNTENMGYEIIEFSYPEHFLQWIAENKPDFNDIELIILSTWFSGNGAPNVKLGNYRGLEFYAEERKKSNNVFYKTKTIIVAFADNDERKLEEYGVKLKKQDEFVSILNLGENIYDFLESKQKIESQ